MASMKDKLAKVTSHLDESVGAGRAGREAVLSPVANSRDIGRRNDRSFGTLEITQVTPDPSQPRKEFDATEIDFLASSIVEQGQLHPIHVRWSDEIGKWIIISGERRYRATIKAGLPTIRCHFSVKDPTPSKILEQQLIENLLRQDLRPVEEARAFEQLIAMNTWTGKQLAEALSVTASKVTRSLALLKLPSDIQTKIDGGEIAASAGYELAKLPTQDQIRSAATDSVTGEMKVTLSKAKSQVRKRQGKPTAKRRSTKGIKQTFQGEGGWQIVVTNPGQTNYHEMEQAVSQALEEIRHRINNNVRLD